MADEQNLNPPTPLVPRGGRRNVVGATPAPIESPASTESAASEELPAPIESTHVLMRAPENCAPITLDGVEHTPDENGDVFIPAKHVEHVKSFKFTVA